MSMVSSLRLYGPRALNKTVSDVKPDDDALNPFGMSRIRHQSKHLG